MDDLGKEQASPIEKPFRVSDYRDGFFQPNGQFSRDPLLSPQAIATWEDDNHRIFDGKAWGAGQALFFQDKPLVFGRNQYEVDVKVDLDPDPTGYAKPELGVSRRHFELQPPSNKKILIHDLGSTNGVKIYSQEGKLKRSLTRDHTDGYLELGDFTLFGGGEDRLIGFRVCEDAAGKLFLVKFTAKNFEDLLALISKPAIKFNPFAKLMAVAPELKPSPEANDAIENAYKILLADITDLRGKVLSRTRVNPEILATYQKLFADLFQFSGDIGERFFRGDWEYVAGLIGKHAMEEGEKAMEDKNPLLAAPALELAGLAFDLANNKLIKFSKEE